MENFQDKGRNDSAMMLYGHGDGGGGPTKDIMERIERLQDCDGIPRIISSNPSDFFHHVCLSADICLALNMFQLEKDGRNLCEWRGELYLELHNGTYTTHADVKRYNRYCEFLLRESEFVQSILFITNKRQYQSFAEEWKKLLLNQFHDVLPGTSINDVYIDANKLYRQVCERLLRDDQTLRSFILQKEDKGKSVEETNDMIVMSNRHSIYRQ